MLPTKMYAANLHGIDDLRYEEIAIPTCESNEVTVKVKNCGVCGSDIGRILSHGTYHFPTIPGHEFAGEVVYDPEGKLTGKRVTVFPLIPCYECEMCKEENYAQCKNYDYYGSRRDGAFAEYVNVKKVNLVELPDNVSYEEGCMSEPTSVALHAVKKIDFKKARHILITGAGTIGIIAGMWARRFGADKVSYIDLEEDKIAFAMKLGFYKYGGGEVDAVIEGTGASVAIASAINAVKAFGQIVLLGNPGGDVKLTAKDYQNILRKELSVSGSWNSSFGSAKNDWKESLAAISSGDIAIKDLITHHVPLSGLYDAIKMMANREELFFKVVTNNEL